VANYVQRPELSPTSQSGLSALQQPDQRFCFATASRASLNCFQAQAASPTLAAIRRHPLQI